MIEIRNPCPMRVENMSRIDGGFHCESCMKVVVDFRNKSNTEVAEHVVLHSNQKTCGIFRPDQVKTSRATRFSLARFVAALLLVFGGILFTGCSEPDPPPIVGEVCVDPQIDRDYQLQQARMKRDSSMKADSMAQADSLSGADSAH